MVLTLGLGRAPCPSEILPLPLPDRSSDMTYGFLRIDHEQCQNPLPEIVLTTRAECRLSGSPRGECGRCFSERRSRWL